MAVCNWVTAGKEAKSKQMGYGRVIKKGPVITQLSKRCDSLGLTEVCGDSWGLQGTHVDFLTSIGESWGEL